MNAPTVGAELEAEPVAIDVKTLNVYQRLNEIKKAVKYVQKDKQVESYMAVTHDAVTSETHDHFVAYGVIVEPHELSGEVKDTGTQTSRGTPLIRFEGRYRIDFVNIDVPTERASVDLTAHAIDHGDKAPGKALSYATKAGVLKMLQLETGEGEESREDAKVTTVTQEQIFEMHAFCEERGLNGDETLKAMATKAYGLKSIQELPKDKFDEAKELLKRKANGDGTANAGVEGSKGSKANSK